MYILDLNNPPNSNFDMDLQFCPKHKEERDLKYLNSRMDDDEKCI